LRPRLDSLFRLPGIQHSACADRAARNGRHFPDCFKRCRSSQRDLQRRKPTFHQRSCQWYGIGDLSDDEYGNDRRHLQAGGKYLSLVHRMLRS
jgi:hypothetical protein